MKLPFAPESFPVESDSGKTTLPEKLLEVTDEAVVHDLQEADTRTSAAAHYERRVAALREAQAEAGVTDEDRERGYRVGEWAGRPNFTALHDGFSHLREDLVKDHVARHRARNL